MHWSSMVLHRDLCTVLGLKWRVFSDSNQTGLKKDKKGTNWLQSFSLSSDSPTILVSSHSAALILSADLLRLGMRTKLPWVMIIQLQMESDAVRLASPSFALRCIRKAATICHIPHFNFTMVGVYHWSMATEAEMQFSGVLGVSSVLQFGSNCSDTFKTAPSLVMFHTSVVGKV